LSQNEPEFWKGSNPTLFAFLAAAVALVGNIMDSDEVADIYIIDFPYSELFSNSATVLHPN
jgi:hypothetical protein